MSDKPNECKCKDKGRCKCHNIDDTAIVPATTEEVEESGKDLGKVGEADRDPLAGWRTDGGRLLPGHPGVTGKRGPNKVGFLRSKFDESIARVGGDELVDKLMDEHPVEMMKMRTQLEPREHHVDVEAAVVQVVIMPDTGVAE